MQNTPQFSVSISPLTTAQQTLSPGDVEQYTATATGGTGSYTYTWYNATNSQQNPTPFACSNCGQGTSSFDLVSGQTSETVALLVQVESGGAFQDSQIAYIQVGSSSTPGSGSTGGTSGTPPNLGGATNAICSVYTTVESIIFILGLTLMILGGALYAGAHVLPGQTRGSVQGYGMGMILGGVIGVIIAVAAPYVLSIATGYSISVITGACAV
ncbi:MAG: hypothetical protein M1360_00815 [Candidatus Marsarchaeota archaeon]|nr:hypothetical protein [Candidatus Marsarchaeota archaeon]MCL5418468.1 hypothetical protein [Candidatus Marsarchaeota archaeon]